MKRRNIIVALCLAFFVSATQVQAQKPDGEGRKYDVAAYLYPAYATGDPRLRPFWPMGMGEWETVLTMQQRYPRHDWNRHPLWGYINEADPAVMEMEIDQATRHGVNVFIFDWYWYDGRPWMETTLTEGFLKARNRDKMQFYLMWANHNVGNDWDTRISHLWESNIVYRGGIDRDEFEKICRRNIELFFKQPNYYKIDGKPVFMIYEVTTFIEGMGGVDAAVDALKWFRNEVKKAGFPDLELQMAMWDSQFNYSGVDGAKVQAGRPRNDFARKLGFNSMSHYQFCHYIWMDDEYDNILSRAYEEWDKLDAEFDIPYYPHVSIGWDNSPRFGESAVVKNNTPDRFEGALRKARAWLDARPDLHPLITINSWNEWTETSYLQPDNVYGYGYLDAVKKVFIDERKQAYVFTYFDNSRQDAGLFLAYSHDGYHWTAVNGGEPIMKPLVGKDGIMRDPSVCQGPDGTFHLVWTISWNARSIGYASSKDLIHWSEQKIIPVMEDIPSTRNTWAPELFYEASEDLFYIFWASTVPDNPEVSTEGCISESGLNHRIYCTTTRDFESFSPTRLYFNPSFNVIDACVVRIPESGELLMAVKNENLNPPEKNIRLTRSLKMADGFPTEVSAPVSGEEWAEGPTIIPVGGDLLIYFDKFREHRYGASISHDGGLTWEDATDRISVPKGMSHGTAIAVPERYVRALSIN